MRIPYALTFTLLAVIASGCIIDADDDELHGNALIFTDTVVFDPDDGVFDQSGTVLSSQFDFPEITPPIVEYGAVLVYFREAGTWTAMPYTFGVESPELPAVDYTISLGYAYDNRLLELFYESSTPEVALENQPTRTFKVVIIDSLPVGKAAPDLRDYEQVKAYYGLDD